MNYTKRSSMIFMITLTMMSLSVLASETCRMALKGSFIAASTTTNSQGDTNSQVTTGPMEMKVEFSARKDEITQAMATSTIGLTPDNYIGHGKLIHKESGIIDFLSANHVPLKMEFEMRSGSVHAAVVGSWFKANLNGNATCEKDRRESRDEDR